MPIPENAEMVFILSYFPRPTFEPPERVPDFDRMRRRYVAFSRARNLLVLTAAAPPAPHFATIWEGLPRWGGMDSTVLDQLLRQRFPVEQPGRPPLPPVDLVIDRVERLVVRPGGEW